MVVLAVFACIVLAGGAYFVYRMLGQDDSLATQIASPASSPTPSVPSVTPTQSTMAPVPEPTATATTTATATATATTITTVTATATATVTTVAEPSCSVGYPLSRRNEDSQASQYIETDKCSSTPEV